MHLIIYLFLFIHSLTLYADISSLQVEAIDPIPEDGTYLIYLNDGRTAFIAESNELLLKNLESALHNETKIDLKLDETHNVLDVSFLPTVLNNLTASYQLYERMREDYKEEAQCYNMAHVWAYEEHKKSGLNSMKLFIFFTRKYIRKYKFKWWFHVANMVHVKERNLLEKIVLDRRYASIPLDIKSWTDHFIEPKTPCPEVGKYQEVWSNQEKDNCYLMTESMYYWQPRDIRLRDQQSKIKKDFIKAEINHAYKQAF
jgi:hypothetical protein